MLYAGDRRMNVVTAYHITMIISAILLVGRTFVFFKRMEDK